MLERNTKEIISYVFVGGMTTLINYVIYFLFLTQLHSEWLLANTIAWSGAVLFAFTINRNYVFQSKNNIYKEAIMFLLLRLFTLAIESCLLFILIQCMNINQMIAKVLVSFITIISNYVFCKQKIFQDYEGEINYEKN